jgi:hypothetical protein
VTPRTELRFRQGDWDRLTNHLFPGDADEHGAAVLCGVVRAGEKIRLVVREVVPALDGTDYIPGVRGYRHLDGAFVTKQLRRARDLGLAYLAAHNHGGRDHVSFSGADLESHERAYPTLLQVNGEAVGGLVLAQQALAGDIWLPDRTRRPIDMTTVVGDRLHRITDGKPSQHALGAASIRRADPVRSRQSLVFGTVGQLILADTTVGIVGAGGVGMLIIQGLGRLGVGNFVVIDPDDVSPTNLSRLPEARTWHAYGKLGNNALGRMLANIGISKPMSKGKLAGQIIHHANQQARVRVLRRDVADDDVARQLRTCDFIFLAADTMLARDVVNQLAYQYLIPTLQVGSKVQLDGTAGGIVDIFGVIRSLGTAPGCLRCNGLVNMARLGEESVSTEQQRRNQRYIDDPDIEAPSVITINAMSVGWALNDFMQYATGIGRPAAGYRLLRTQPVGRGSQFTVQHPDVNLDCHVCGLGSHSALSRGDATDLPTRMRA